MKAHIYIFFLNFIIEKSSKISSFLMQLLQPIFKLLFFNLRIISKNVFILHEEHDYVLDEKYKFIPWRFFHDF